MLYFNKNRKISIETTERGQYRIHCSILDLCWDWKDENEFINVVEWLIKEKLKGSVTLGIIMQNVFAASFVSKISKCQNTKFKTQQSQNLDDSSQNINITKMNEKYQFLLDLTKIELLVDFLIENKIFLKAPPRQVDANALIDMLPRGARGFVMEAVSFNQLIEEAHESTGQTRQEIFLWRLDELKSILTDNLHPLHDSYGVQFIGVVRKISRWLLMMTEFLDTTQFADDFKEKYIALSKQKHPLQTTDWCKVYANVDFNQPVSDILTLCLNNKE